MSSLYIYMNGHEVGELIEENRGTQEFKYTDTWLNLSGAVPLSLSLPLTEQVHRGDKVYNYFDNLLPDSLEIRQRIQSRFGVKTNQPFDLLSHIGIDCVGAIQLLSQPIDSNIKQISSEPVNEAQIATILRNYKTLPLGMSKDKDFRISLAGAQEKTALLWHENKWQTPTGATPTSHIFKLPIGFIDHNQMDLTESVENEWLCLKMLSAFNLNAAEASIEKFEDTKALVVKRFDRRLSDDNKWILRLPQEDMCQANGYAPGLKYEDNNGPGIATIMETLMSSMHPEKDRKTFFKTLFVFWLLAATDGHAKNYSIALKARGRFELTPLYDVISTYPLMANKELKKRDVKMAMALHGKHSHYDWYNIMPRHWFDEASKVNFPKNELQNIIDETLSDIDNVIRKVKEQLPEGFPEHIASSIFSGIQEAAKVFKRRAKLES